MAAGRGIGPDAVASYLAPALGQLPDPARLIGMDAAVERLVAAITTGQTVGVFGDYDVDGVTSTTLLCEVLEGLGGSVVATVPDRLVEGYGLSRAGVDRLAAAGAKLIVTVDCGVTAHDEVAYAASVGLEVVVIDHHTAPVSLPEAVAVINPHRADCQSGATHLCAVGVTFNLCLALRRQLRDAGYFDGEHKEPDLREVMDLVALGTVADVVPLIQDNRVLINFGLKVIKRRQRPGMAALLDVAGVQPERLSASTLGFQIGPRINAAGRLGDAMKAVELFRTHDPKRAARLAGELDDENQSRRDLERRILEEASEQVVSTPEIASARVIVVGDPSWHPGVVGIVASRLVDRFGRPAVVIGDDGRGSGRSIPKFQLFDALCAVREHLLGFGGHAHAAGVRIDMATLPAFRAALVAYAEAHLALEDLGRVISYDGTLRPGEVTPELVHTLAKAAPYGRANPEPLFLLRDVQLRGVRELRGGHLKGVMQERPRIEVICFGAGERMETFLGRIDLLATPEINTWRGQETLQLRVRDFRATEKEAA